MSFIKAVWDFYKQLFISNRKWILVSAVIFLVAALAGAVSYSQYPGLINQFLDYLRQIAGENPQLDNRLVWAIFSQNFRASLIALFGGAILGLIPILLVVLNGFMIGYIENFFLSSLNTSVANKLLVTLATLAPHGIFELPIIIVSAALGMKLGLEWMAQGAQGNRRKVFGRNFLLCIKFIPLLVVILAAAAFLEVYVSGVLASLASNFVGQ